MAKKTAKPNLADDDEEIDPENDDASEERKPPLPIPAEVSAPARASCLTFIFLVVAVLITICVSWLSSESLMGSLPWYWYVAIVVLILAAALLAVLSEILVGSIEGFIEQFDLTPFFVGVVLIPTIGNLAEHLVAVQLAAKDKMEFAMAVAYGSSLQVALFVAPVLVLLGALLGQPMDLVFTPLEVAAVAAAVGISALIALDGESNWLEGALLIIVYVILAVSFFEFV